MLAHCRAECTNLALAASSGLSASLGTHRPEEQPADRKAGPGDDVDQLAAQLLQSQTSSVPVSSELWQLQAAWHALSKAPDEAS